MRRILAALVAVLLSSGIANADSDFTRKAACAAEYQSAILTTVSETIPMYSNLADLAEAIFSETQKMKALSDPGEKERFYMRMIYPLMRQAADTLKTVTINDAAEDVVARIASEFANAKSEYLQCIGETAQPKKTDNPKYQPVKTQPAASHAVTIGQTEMKILEYTNAERAKKGLAQLTLDEKLSNVAAGHSLDMASKNYFSHVNLQGENPTKRAERMGYDVHKNLEGGWSRHGIGENLGKLPTGNVRGYGYVANTPDAIAKAQVALWMNSEGHRANILKGDYDLIGIGVSMSSSGFYYSTQNFK